MSDRSTVEPMILLTVLLLVAVAVGYARIDDLIAFANDVGNRIASWEWVQRLVGAA